MNVLVNAAEQNRLVAYKDNMGPHTQLTPAEITDVRAVADAHVKTSASAEVVLTAITGEQFLHPFKKIQSSGARIAQHKGENDDFIQGDKEADSFRLYPNPNDGNMQLEYYLEREQTGELSIFNLTGQLVAYYKLDANSSLLKISETNLAAGLYIYQIKINGNAVLQNKLIITY